MGFIPKPVHRLKLGRFLYRKIVAREGRELIQQFLYFLYHYLLSPVSFVLRTRVSEHNAHNAMARMERR